MQIHRTAWPAALARPGSRRYEDQRRLILELVVDPPRRGDDPRALAAALRRPPAAIEDAAAALARAGLAERHAGRVRASAAALAFEALWPIAP